MAACSSNSIKRSCCLLQFDISSEDSHLTGFGKLCLVVKHACHFVCLSLLHLPVFFVFSLLPGVNSDINMRECTWPVLLFLKVF